MTDDSSVDIYVVGTGMVGYRQFTREAEAALDASEVAFLGHYQDVMWDFVAERVDEVVDLHEEYELSGSRVDTYRAMADLVLDGAEVADGPVTLALYGHPTIFVSPSRMVVEDAPDRGLTVEMRPGISSLDCLFTDLAFDPAEQGMQTFEATDLLIREFDLNPYVPLFVWQIASVETKLYYPGTSKPERFTRIREYLQRFYPDDHTVYLLETATYPIAESEQLAFDLDEFESMHEEVKGSQTLYVPPIEEKGVENEEMVRLAESPEHVRSLVDRE